MGKSKSIASSRIADPIKDIVSRITEKDLDRLRSFPIDSRFHLRVPRPDKSSLSARANEVCLYTDFFSLGDMQLPVNYEMAHFLSDVALAPLRLVPNSITHIHCFIGLCQKHGLECTALNARLAFSIDPLSNIDFSMLLDESLIANDLELAKDFGIDFGPIQTDPVGFSAAVQSVVELNEEALTEARAAETKREKVAEEEEEEAEVPLSRKRKGKEPVTEDAVPLATVMPFMKKEKTVKVPVPQCRGPSLSAVRARA